MKRKLAVLTAAAVLAAPLAANAAPPKKPAAPKKTTRTVTFDYQGTETVTVEGGAWGSVEQCAMKSCFNLDTVKGEKSVTVTAKDQTGTPTGMQIWLDDDYDTVTFYCGTASLKVSTKSAHALSIRPAVSSGCQALPTQGTLTAVVTNF